MRNEKEKINPDVKYETSDANAKWLGAIGAAIVISAILLIFFLWGLYGYFEQTAAKGAPITEAVSKQKFDTAQSPPLEPKPLENYEQFRRAENEKLNGYGWIDRQNGVVYIPIERAMKMLVNKGLPEIKQSADTNLSNANSNMNSEKITQKNNTKK